MAKGKVKAVRHGGFHKFTMSDFVRKPTLMRKLSEYAINSAKRPIAGPLADGAFIVSHGGSVTLSTLPGEYKRGVTAPIGYIAEHIDTVLGLIRPESAPIVVANKVERVSEKDAMLALTAQFGLDDETAVTPPDESAIDEDDDDNGEEEEE